MRRLEHGLLRLVVQVGHGLHVGQDAGGDHQRQHVDGDQEDGADDEDDDEGVGHGVLVDLDLHHGHHGEAGQQRRRAAGRLQLGAAQVQHLPVVNVLVHTLETKTSNYTQFIGKTTILLKKSCKRSTNFMLQNTNNKTRGKTVKTNGIMLDLYKVN